MQSGIHEDIQLYPNAYNTPLGDFYKRVKSSQEVNGKIVNISTLFKNGNIMILDEPTAALILFQKGKFLINLNY